VACQDPRRRSRGPKNVACLSAGRSRESTWPRPWVDTGIAKDLPQNTLTIVAIFGAGMRKLNGSKTIFLELV
jgi:hypothetical protein